MSTTATTPRLSAVLAMHSGMTRGLFSSEQRARLGALCELLDESPLERFDDERADTLLARAQVLITGWGCPPIDAAVLDRAPKLALIAHAAGTVKVFLKDVVWERGITVTNAVSANAAPVAEYTLAAILFSNKRVLGLQRMYRDKRSYEAFLAARDPALGNYERVIGIVGASHVGRRVLELLQPYDLRALVVDPYLDADAANELGAEKVELDALLERSDVVSLHVPAIPETHHMIGAAELARMRDGATLINTARGSVVDHAALEKELVSGRIEAVIDTTEPEVLPADSPLYDLPNVLLTPHIAGSLGGEVRRMSELALDEVGRFTRGEPLLHAITLDALPRLA